MITPDQLDEISISKESSLLEALKKMDVVSHKLLIVFAGNKVAGLLSIGDIQRAIISNLSLDTKITTILKKDFLVCYLGDPVERIKEVMFTIRAEFMPVLDKDGSLNDVYFWKDILDNKGNLPVNQFNLPIVIMAGGFGTRLRPLTNILPKPLIPIGEKTILEEIFQRFERHGSKNFYISVNYKADFIRSYVEGLNSSNKVEFFEEKSPMGTAGSLTLLKDKINQTFIVSNCDILIDQDYSEILKYHYENKNEITVVAVLKHFPIAYGIIETGENGQLLDMKEKPELTFKINSGMYILEPHLLNEIPENKFFHITELIDIILKRNGNVGVFPISEKSWSDIGDWPEYKKVLSNNGFII